MTEKAAAPINKKSKTRRNAAARRRIRGPEKETIMRSNAQQDKLQEALDLLNEAAREKSEELYQIVEDKYAHIRQVLKDQTENGKEKIDQARRQFTKKIQAEEEKLVERAKTLDKKVHSNPWPFLGVAAIGALAVGIVLGKK